ncbi:MAG: hypothetical protein K6G40_07245 [Eubacterium sp.]|nr:hypothetical protein [Eubacterium sp.]
MKKIEKNITLIGAVLVMAVCALFVSGIPQSIVIAENIGDYSVSAAEYKLYYYWEYYDYISEHADEDLTSQGLYTNSKLHKQESPYGMSWDEYFNMLAKETLQEEIILCDVAKNGGYVLSEEGIEELEKEKESIAQQTEECGLSSEEKYLKKVYSSAVTPELYYEAYERSLLAKEYKNILLDSISITQDELEEYISENEIEDEGYAADVVIILINAESDRYTGEVTERQMENLKIRCENILEKFYEMGNKQSNFEELAAAYSQEEDVSVTRGVKKELMNDKYPEAVCDWYSDENRISGDITTVIDNTTAYIIYYINQGDKISNIKAETALKQELYEEYLQSKKEQYPIGEKELGMLIAKL